MSTKSLLKLFQSFCNRNKNQVIKKVYNLTSSKLKNLISSLLWWGGVFVVDRDWRTKRYWEFHVSFLMKTSQKYLEEIGENLSKIIAWKLSENSENSNHKINFPGAANRPFLLDHYGHLIHLWLFYSRLDRKYLNFYEITNTMQSIKQFNKK